MSNIYPITFTLTNIIKIISFMSPFLLSLTIILFSILNNKILQGLVLLIGIVIVTFINYLLKNIIKSKQSSTSSPFCNILPFPFTYRDNESVYDSPSLGITVLAFIMSYLMFPMFTHGEINYAIIIFGVVFICLNGVVEFMDNCSQIGGIILGFIVGLILGILYYNLIVNSGHKDIAYFNDPISNNTQCSKPGPTKFRCKKYVRGDRDKAGNYNPMAPVQETKSSINPSINVLNAPNVETNFQMSPIWADPRDISGTFYKIRTYKKGGIQSTGAGFQEAKHFSNLLKCSDPIADGSYIYFGNLIGRQGDISKYNEFIVDCSRTNPITYDFIDIITGEKNGIIPWKDHKDQSTNIISNIGSPQLDLISLTYIENTNGTRQPTNFYLIPGAGDNVICDSLAEKIGCTQCIKTETFIKGTPHYNVALNLLYENPGQRVNNFSNDPSLGAITSVQKAGWGLTQCPTPPEDVTPFKVYKYPIDMNGPSSGTTYGYEPGITNNRYAYWLKSGPADEVLL